MIFQALTENLVAFVERTELVLPFLGALSLFLFGVLVLNRLLGGRLLFLGIQPRTRWGLFGVLFAPFLHADFNHLFFNLIPLVVLSDFILIQGFDLYLWVSALIVLISGILTWCFGKSGIHVGASSVVTGYWAWLVMNAYTQGSFLAILLSGVSVYYFITIFFGIFPSKRDVSWEGHLFGLIAGGGVSFLPLVQWIQALG